MKYETGCRGGPCARPQSESDRNPISGRHKVCPYIGHFSKRFSTPIYLVGGPVRDALLNRPCHDWDFVCRHARQIALGLSRKLHATFIVLDEQNRIYRVIAASPEPSPVGRGRSEAAGEARTTLDFAEMQGKSIEEDLSRRDFTINAMAVPLTSSRRIVHRQGQPNADRLADGPCFLPETGSGGSRDPSVSMSKPLGPGFRPPYDRGTVPAYELKGMGRRGDISGA